MIQNIKIDTLYYLTNSDFEMEFNLCGCCKMRLLTDKAENAKNFVGLLARAVSRSQVIICCGKLFGEDGLINIVSSAIRKPLAKINNTDYGIADSSDISIIDGSVPLVNGDGCFCGCIAESGPQAIILLTENKSIRKTVMKSLIHPYIEELSMLMHKNSTESKEEEVSAEPIIPPVAPMPVVPPVAELELPTPEITLPTDENADETAEEVETVGEAEDETAETTEETEETVDSADLQENQSVDPEEDVAEPNATEKTESEAEADVSEATDEAEETELPDVIIDDPVEYEEDTANYVDPVDINSGFGLYLEPERVKYKRESHYALDYTPSEQDNAFISESEDDYLYEEDRKFLSLPILIVVIILLLALAVLAYMLILVPIRSDYVFSEFIRNIFSVSVDFI